MLKPFELHEELWALVSVYHSETYAEVTLTDKDNPEVRVSVPIVWTSEEKATSWLDNHPEVDVSEFELQQVNPALIVVDLITRRAAGQIQPNQMGVVYGTDDGKVEGLSFLVG